jgi:hypothetical protein
VSKKQSKKQSKEEFYDREISPLMAEIIKKCKKYNINMFSTFALDTNDEEEGPLFCAASLPVDKKDSKGFKKIEELHGVLKNRYDLTPKITAFTIITEKRK